MSFPSNNVISLTEAWQRIRALAGIIRQQTQVVRAQALNGMAGTLILSYTGLLADYRAQLVAVAATPGLADYAQTQMNNPSLDIVAEYNAMVTQIDATIAWIIANYLKDASSNLLSQHFNPNNSGFVVDNVFDAASLATFVTQLDALLATIG